MALYSDKIIVFAVLLSVFQINQAEIEKPQAIVASPQADGDAKGNSPISCHVCSTKETENCYNPGSSGETCESEAGKCFTLVGESVLCRGCAEESFPEEGLFKYNQVMICSNQPNCNTHQIIQEQCFQYKFEIQLHGGASYERKIKERTEPKQCSPRLSTNGCFYRIGANGDTLEAGCAADIAEDGPADSSKITKYCDGDDCNSPSKHFTCLLHRSINRDDEFFAFKSKYESYGENDKCFTYIGDGNMVHRGCLSKADETIQTGCKSTEKCLLCDNEILCNYRLVEKIDNSQTEPDSKQNRTQALPNDSGCAQNILSLSILMASIFVAVFISQF